MKVNGLVLAAGMSTRMQEFKPLMKIDGKTMIETTVTHMLASGVDQVTVVVGYRGREVEQALSNLCNDTSRLKIVYNKDYETTQMLDSIQIGLADMRACDGFFLTPGDMPAIAVSTYQQLMAAAKKNKRQGNVKVIFPLIDGYRKHPPYIDFKCREDILNFNGAGLRALWKEYEGNILELPIKDEGCNMDADYRTDFIRICHYMEKC